MKKLFFISLFLIGYTGFSQSARDSSYSALSAPGGRYVFGQIGLARADQFMLDTQTGRLWRLVVDKNDAPLLQIVPYQMTDGTPAIAAPTEEEDLAAIMKKLQEDKDAKEKKK